MAHRSCAPWVARRGVLGEADLDVYPGEVVGIAGLLGSGRSRIARRSALKRLPDVDELRMPSATCLGTGRKTSPAP